MHSRFGVSVGAICSLLGAAALGACSAATPGDPSGVVLIPTAVAQEMPAINREIEDEMIISFCRTASRMATRRMIAGASRVVD